MPYNKNMYTTGYYKEPGPKLDEESPFESMLERFRFAAEVLELDEVKALADVPSREELLGRLASGLKRPLNGLVHCLKDPVKSLAYALKAVKDKKEE